MSTAKMLQAQRLKAQNKTKEGAKSLKVNRHETSTRTDTNTNEDRIVELVDNVHVVRRMEKSLQKLHESGDVQGFLSEISPQIAQSLALAALNGDSEKIRLEAQKDILDRAGYGRIQKHAIARVDVKDSKEAILAKIMGAQKDLKAAGIEIEEDDDEDQEK